LLFGKAESSTTKPKVYIGEAENVYGRLVQHVAEKEFWNESVVFISKDENLNKAHIKYLESRLFEIATLTARYELQNSNTPTRSSISESDQSELEEFIEYIKMLINTMGFKVFEPFIKDSLVASVNSENLYIKSTKGANACGKRVADGFVIFKGTIITNDIVPSLSKGFKALRDELIENKLINEVNGKLEFMSDYLFSSPSSAAAVVLGRNANGLMEWKDNQGKELKAIEAQEIQQT
jgi:hypothetical protein